MQVVNYCHSLNIPHRNLTPSNILICGDLGLVKLIDFGYSSLDQLDLGTIGYIAPELLFEHDLLINTKYPGEPRNPAC